MSLDIQTQVGPVTIEANVLPDICNPLIYQPIKTAVSNYPNFRGLYFSDFHFNDHEQLGIDILIGSDYCFEFLTGQLRNSGDQRGPVAFETKLGWVLNGPMPNSSDLSFHESACATTHTLKCSERVVKGDKLLDQQVSKLWDLETIGIKTDENLVVESFLDSIEYDKGVNLREIQTTTKVVQYRLMIAR